MQNKQNKKTTTKKQNKNKTILKMPKRVPKNTVSPCIYLDTAWKPSRIYSITGWLKF